MLWFVNLLFILIVSRLKGNTKYKRKKRREKKEKEMEALNFSFFFFLDSSRVAFTSVLMSMSERFK